MKRRRNSTASNAKRRRNGAERGKVSHIQINYSGPPYSDLPNNILVNILLRLTIKRIFVCKCVCKMWNDLISDPDFAKLHFDQAKVYPLLRTSGFTLLSRMLYLVQPEQDDFERMREMRSYKIDSPIKIKLDSKFKLPLHNIHMILDKDGVHKYNIVNSCNGLLCLSNPSDNDPVVVCNPVTGEFINLPEVRTSAKDFGSSEIQCGFGFSPTPKLYKVIRMFTHRIGQDIVMVAEVHVLGTKSWKDLAFFPKSWEKLFPTYLNGCVYGFSPMDMEPCSVISFDIEKEHFESISPPPLEVFHLVPRLSMGVLGGELVVSEAFGEFSPLNIWAMKDDGATKSWSEIFSFHRWPYGSYQPITYLNDGALLMFHSRKHALICKHPEKDGFRYLKVHGLDSKVEAIAHIPSFVSLKHALSGDDVEILNIKSRCSELKLHGESKGISIVEEDRNSEIDTDDMDDQEFRSAILKIGITSLINKSDFEDRDHEFDSE